MPEGELGRSPRERLLPLIIGMRPDLHSCITITCSLTHVFYNLRYGVVDAAWIDCLEALKREGALYQEVFNTLVELFTERDEWRPLVRDLRMLQDTRPDYLFGRKRILCVVERPPRRRPAKP